MVDGVNPLDPLGPIVGSLGQPSLDPNSYLPFEGEVIKPHVINFPDPGGDRRNTIGTPGIVSRSKPKLTDDDIDNFNNSIIRNFNNKIASGRTKDEFATYQTYDAGPDSNAFYDRYMAYGQEKFDQVGFHPLRDNEANFNANTTWWDDFKRMTTHSFIPLVGLGFKAGPKSLAKMLNGDFTGSDLNEAKEYERAAAIGQSSKDGIGAFFNNTLMNFGYTAGIITEIMAEEAALFVGTELSGGTLGGAAALRTSQNIVRGVEAVSTFGKMYDRTRKMVNSFSNVNAARQFWKAANSKVGRFINPLENTFEGINQLRKASKAGDQIDGLAVLSKTAGGFYRDVRTINMAVSEARLEAGMVENHLLDGYYSEFYAQNNRAPDEKEIKDMRALAKKGSLETFYTNAGLIYLTNKITFNNITGPRGGIRNFMQSTMDDIYTIGSRAGEKNFGDIGKILYDNTKKEFVFRANNLKSLAKSWWKEPGVKTLAKTVGYFKANVSEGLQENLQETIARANERYYNEAFKSSNLLKGQLYANGVNRLGYKDVNGIFNTPLEYYKQELGKEFSKQGAETFASGFLMGTFASPLNNAMPFLSTQWNRMYNKEAYQKWKDMKLDISKNIVQQLNAVDMNEFLNNRVVNLSAQDIISNIKKNGSYKEGYDAEVESYVRSVGTMLRTGTTDVFINKLKSYNDLTDDELIDAVKGDDIKDAPMYRERIDKAVSKLERIQKKYEQAEERFPNPVNIYNIDKNKMSAVEYNQYAALYNAWEEAKFNYVYFNEAFEDTAKRMKSIERDYLQGSSLQDVEYGSAKNLFRPDEIKQDIANLETELELERSKGESKFDLTTDGLTKKRIKLLEQQIADLKAYDEAYTKFNRFYNRGEVLTTEVELELQKELGRTPTPEEIADRINEIEGDETNQDRQIEILDKLKQAHDNYLRNLAENSNSTVFQENLDNGFNQLLDYYKLGNERKVMARSVDILNDPKGYADLVGKNLSFMRRLYDNRSEFFEQMVNEQIEMIENNALLNALANQGLFVSADDFAEYIKTGRPPSEIYDHARKVVYKEGTEMYNKIYQEYFVKNEQLKNQNVSVTPTFVDEVYQKKYEDLNEEAKRKIDALPKEIQRVNKGVVKPLTGETMSLREALEQMEPQEYIELNYEGDEGVPVKYYLDENGVLRVDGPAGGIIDADILDDSTAQFTEGIRYAEELAPDPVAVEQIMNDLKQQIEDLVESYKEDKAIEEESGKADAFVPLSTDTDVEDLPSALRKELKDLYDSYLKTTMPEEDYVNMTQDEYESGFSTFVKSGSPLVKEAINKYNKSQEVGSVVRTKGVKDDFEFEFAGKTYNTKDLDVPTIRSYQRQIRNNIETLSKTDPIIPSLEALIVNLDKVANKKLLAGFTEAQSEAIKKIQELKAKQKDYKVDSTGYTIEGDFYKRVTQIIQPLKSKKQSYKDAKKVEEIFNSTFAVNGFNLDSINDFISQLRDKKLSGFSEFTYKELEDELKSLLAKGEEVFIPINKEAQIKSLIENFEPDTIDEISEIGVDENNKIVAIINGQNYTKDDLEESSKDPRAAKNKALFTKLINEVDRLQKLLDDQIAAIPESTTTTPVSDKKADIERRRQEKLDSIKINTADFTVNKNRAIAPDVITDPIQANRSILGALNNDFSEKRINEYEDLIKKSQISNEQKILILTELEKIKINAKYDAELDALESTTQVSTAETTSTKNLLQEIQNTVLEKTYEASRIVGNYIDNAIKNLFDKGVYPARDNSKISDEAYESLFGVDGYLTELKKLHDSGEVYIASQGLVVYDKELGIAGEIDLLVADRKGNIYIVDIKTGEKTKWDNFNKETSPYSKLEEYALQQTAYANLLNRMIGVNPAVAILPIQIVKDTETGKIESAKRPSTPDLISKDSKFLIKLDKNLVQDKINLVIPLTKTTFKPDTTADIFEDEDIETTDDDQTSPIKDAINEDDVPTEVISDKEKALVKDLLDEIYKSGSENIKAIRGKISILNHQDELSSESLDTLNDAIRKRETELEEEPEEAITLDMLKEGTELIAKNDVYIDKKTPYVKQGESIKIISVNNDGTVNFVKLIGKRPTKQKDYSMKKLNANFELSNPISKPDIQKDSTMTDLDKDYVKQGGDIVSNFLNSKDDLARVEKDIETKSIDKLDDEFFDEDNLICE